MVIECGRNENDIPRSYQNSDRQGQEFPRTLKDFQERPRISKEKEYFQIASHAESLQQQ